MSESDPYKEPENSTVDDWHGQKGKAAEERADELLEESGGDRAEAERRFEEEAPQ